MKKTKKQIKLSVEKLADKFLDALLSKKDPYDGIRKYAYEETVKQLGDKK